MKEQVTKLIDVKTIVTLSLLVVYNYLAVIGRIEPDIFSNMVLMVVSYYFGTQHEKAKQEKEVI